MRGKHAGTTDNTLQIEHDKQEDNNAVMATIHRSYVELIKQMFALATYSVMIAAQETDKVPNEHISVSMVKTVTVSNPRLITRINFNIRASQP